MAPTSGLKLRDTSSNADDPTSDKLALAAVVIAVFAFFISFLQTVIAYLASQVRDKCSRGAIGGWQKFSKTRWDFWNYRLRVLYPQIDFDCLSILQYRRLTDLMRQKALSTYFPAYVKSKGAGWMDMMHCDDRDSLRFWHIWYGTNVLGIGTKAVTFFHLPFRAKLEWFMFLYRYGGRQNTVPARASWANVIACMGTQPTKGLVRRLELADIIPNRLDAPWQTTSLSNVGLLCFVLGMKHVNVNIQEGTITAHNEYASLTTTKVKVPGMPLMVTLSGDLDNLRASLAKPITQNLVSVARTANGMIDFVNFAVNPFFCDPTVVIYGLRNVWDDDDWVKYGKVRLLQRHASEKSVGCLYWEAVEADGIGSDDWTSHWKKLGVGASPSLLQLLAFLPYSSMCSGFPLRSYLTPYDNHFFESASKWWTHGGRDFCSKDSALTFRVAKGDVPFLRETESFLLTAKILDENHGSRSWIFHRTRQLLRNWDKTFELTLADSTTKFPITAAVGRLLEGDTVDQVRSDQHEKLFTRIEEYTNVLQSTIEAELWFTLATLEARIESIWDRIVNTENTSSPERKTTLPAQEPLAIPFQPAVLQRAKTSSLPASQKSSSAPNPDPKSTKTTPKATSTDDSEDGPNVTTDDLDPETLVRSAREDKKRLETILIRYQMNDIPSRNIGKAMAGFMALWIAMCKEVDPHSPVAEVRAALAEVLESWNGDHSLVFPRLPAEYYEITPPLRLMYTDEDTTRDRFYQWAIEGDRKSNLLSLVFWLQLRSILLYHFLHCNGDSSDVAGAESSRLRIRFG